MRAVVLFILAILNLPLWAQNVQKPFLYRVSTPRGDSYILGTIHAYVRLEDFQFDLKPFIEGADVFMPEWDTNQTKLELMEKDWRAALRMYVAQIPASKKRVDEWTAQKLIEFGFPADVAPQLQDSCIELPLLIEFTGRLPIDGQVMQIAHRSHRQISNLDTEELREQALKLMKCDLHQVFAANDPKEFFNELNDEVRADASFYRLGVEPTSEDDPGTILRNKAWLPKIENNLSTGTVFVSVGYGHLFGPYGILQLLRNDGYSITRVSSDGN